MVKNFLFKLGLYISWVFYTGKQPDDGGYFGISEDYVGINPNGRWNDFSKDVKLDYIVEYGRPGAEYKLENLSVSNGVEGNTDPVLTFTFDREVPAELNFQLNFDLFYDGKKINSRDILSNVGNGDLSFPTLEDRWR